MATEAKQIGTGVTRKTIRKGIKELEAGEIYEPGGRIRRRGGGRRQTTDKDETLRADLEELLEPKGDPQSQVQWTTKSMSKLKEGHKSQGHAIGETAIRIANEGGYNGARNRLWKMQLQQFATETGLSIAVCHLPPA